MAGQVKITGGVPALGKVLTSDGVGLATWESFTGAGGGGWTDDGTAVRLTTISDNVGIGTTSPGSTLQIGSSGTGNGKTFTQFINEGTANSFRLARASDSYPYMSFDGKDFSLITAASGTISLGVGGVAQMTFGPAGSTNIGIGTTNPTGKLHIKQVSDVAGGGLRFEISSSTNSWDIFNTSAAYLGFAYNASTVMTLANNGTVGIGTAAPAYTLDVCGDIRATGSVYYGGTCGTANGTLYTKPDYVFEPDYKLYTPTEVEKFIDQKGHLPWLTSATIEKKENNGAVNITRMSFETLEAVENMQLQIIELTKQNEAMQKRIEKLEHVK